MSSTDETLLCRYQYDPLDRLADCTPSTQARTQRFYLKERLTSEIQGSIQRSIFQQDDQLLAQQQRQDGGIETTLLATDQQRSVLHALDATQPHPLAYTPYGHRAPENGLLSLLGFNGERPDPVTGHYLLGNGYRAFNPVLMRFNSPDSLSPFGEGGLNTYVYCVGDPVNRGDPTGHISLFSKLAGLLDNFKAPTTTVTTEIAAPIAKPNKSSFINGVFETAAQSLYKNTTAPAETMSPARQYLDNIVKPISNPEPFIKKLKIVNRNLASHGDENLSMAQALHYEKIVREVNSGKFSNTFAHVQSANGWIRSFVEHPTPTNLVGATFNGIGGPLLSGVYDHGLYKTGQALRRGSLGARLIDNV
ncbi:RHS repeat-associated core domain-containing protein [Pseudomonas sp. T1.Ur]|uniref:RHS repeat-associated core domain-containing protein n=1 Tax=Pseudomonas sp. T1.Ur TaxID=2928704 RepID=UPI00201DB92F|nr:RHS repeat-associated core domain-containing protein [Pseudomonas sp. T1.Ur]MCL6705193.1 RHS repeat-associated core domain-containing protein [Pseudomonas sp. T1.Ur]